MTALYSSWIWPLWYRKILIAVIKSNKWASAAAVAGLTSGAPLIPPLRRRNSVPTLCMSTILVLVLGGEDKKRTARRCQAPRLVSLFLAGALLDRRISHLLGLNLLALRNLRCWDTIAPVPAWLHEPFAWMHMAREPGRTYYQYGTCRNDQGTAAVRCHRRKGPSARL